MTSLDDLLPASDQSLRCADFSRDIGVDPGGTAIRADRLVLVETPLPWPKPVFNHPLLADVASIMADSAIPTRTLAYVPDGGSDTGMSGASDGISNTGPGGASDGISNAGSHPATIITFDRVSESAGVIERHFHPSGPEGVRALAAALVADDQQALTAAADHQSDLVTPVALVCTQGSHDVCCGSEGARFAAEAETIADLRVYRVSHTGGHRFAPTAMTLPDGRMWADLDRELLQQILSKTGDVDQMVDRCRGWWGAPTGGAQVAERAVFGSVGWEFDQHRRTVEARGESSDGAARFAVSSGEQTWEVTVAIGREVPTIACRQPGGLPAKRSVEYEVQQIVADEAD